MERMGYPTPPLSSGRHSPKTSSLPPYASQLTQGQYNVEVQRPGNNSRTHSYNNRNQRQLGLIGDAPHDETKSYYQGAYDAETRTYAETAYDDENRTYVGQSSPTTYTKPYYPSSPTHTYRTPRSRTGSPILQRIPSPYSASRPKPRKGFVKRVISKFREWVRSIARYAARHPLKMGLMSLLPVVAIGGMVKGLVSAGRGLMKFLGEEGKREKKGGKENKSEDKKPSGDGIFDQFVKFGGSKGGALDGILKIMQMLVNHYCKLTPHAFPRAASIILELYFLEPWKL